MSLPDGYRPPTDDENLLAECDVTVFQASGPGGQHRNRSRTAVRLVHRPSGIVVIGRRERSQRQNLADALSRLRERLAERLRKPKPRRETKPTRASKKRRVEAKKHRGDIKRLRGKPDRDA
jgi:protein subunit release factor A